jgi:cytochrome c-type biogenesis protein CcmH
MVWFWIVAGLLTLAALAALLRPLVRRPRPGSGDDEPVAALFRRQIAEIDAELAQGRLMPDQAAAARTELTRRMLTAAEHGEAATRPEMDRGAETFWRVGGAIGIAGVLPAAAIAVYVAVGSPSAIDRSPATEAAAPHGAPELTAAADRIKTHLKEAPDDLKGWVLLARTLASLNRFPEARDAYSHAVALAPGEAGLHAELGEVLVLEAEGKVTTAAEAEFAKAPDDPRSRYYGAAASLQHGNPAAARQKLQALLADAPADAPWRQAVADSLAQLAPSGPSAGNEAAASAPGPTAQDLANARTMSPEQQQAIIRGMVERLAERLKQHPEDKDGWARLAHAYDVLGEPDKAKAARARQTTAGTSAPATATAQTPPTPDDAQGWITLARSYQGRGRTADALAALKQGTAQFPGDMALLEAYMNALASAITDDKLSPELVDLAARINVLDGKQPDALWYLGVAAAQSGDGFRAASYWAKLRDELPPGDSRRAVVQHKLDALR